MAKSYPEGSYPTIRASKKTDMSRRYATYIDLTNDKGNNPGPVGDRGRPRFPLPDAKHARLALARLPLAKGLTAEEKRHIAQRAANVLGRVTPGAARYGVRRVTASPSTAIHQAPIVMPRSRKNKLGRS